MVIGKKDISVYWQLDEAPLEAVAANMNKVSFVYPEDANHVLKNDLKSRAELTAVDGMNFNAADKVLDPQTIDAIKEWLNTQSGKQYILLLLESEEINNYCCGG